VALQSKFTEIAVKLEPAVLAAALAGAELVAEGARERVPVVTGRLRDAIHVEEDPEGAAVVAGDSKAWYGHIVEHGHVAQDGSTVAPRPFLIPSLEANRDGVIALVAAAIKKATS
jgi:hypothetical protein